MRIFKHFKQLQACIRVLYVCIKASHPAACLGVTLSERKAEGSHCLLRQETRSHWKMYTICKVCFRS